MDKDKLCYDLAMLCVKEGLKITENNSVSEVSLFAAKTFVEAYRIIKTEINRTSF